MTPAASRPPHGTWSDALNASHRIALVQEIFDCFERGDLPGILARVDEQVQWRHAGDPAVVPFAGEFQGWAGTLQYLQAVRQSIRITTLVLQQFRHENNQVLVDIQVLATAIATGISYPLESTLIWTIGEKGKVTHLFQRGDVSALEAAFRG
ncbi:MAG: nuclear transport factor 2 family protein [Saprospiraceae bacterium]|nr:nuclear transport factor 2 family protein [Saprospiraceae bacterium]